MEIQLRDEENAALGVFIVLLCKMVTDNHYNSERGGSGGGGRAHGWCPYPRWTRV